MQRWWSGADMEITPRACLLVTLLLPFLASLLWTGSRLPPRTLVACAKQSVNKAGDPVVQFGPSDSRAERSRRGLDRNLRTD